MTVWYDLLKRCPRLWERSSWTINVIYQRTNSFPIFWEIYDKTFSKLTNKRPTNRTGNRSIWPPRTVSLLTFIFYIRLNFYSCSPSDALGGVFPFQLWLRFLSFSRSHSTTVQHDLSARWLWPTHLLHLDDHRPTPLFGHRPQWPLRAVSLNKNVPPFNNSKTFYR